MRDATTLRTNDVDNAIDKSNNDSSNDDADNDVDDDRRSAKRARAAVAAALPRRSVPTSQRVYNRLYGHVNHQTFLKEIAFFNDE